MANISQVNILNNTYNIKDNYFDHFYEIKGNNYDNPGIWTLREDRITSYTEGLLVLYTITVAGGSNGTTLDIMYEDTTAEEIVSLGNKPIYLQNGEALKTQYSVGKSIFLRYSSLLGVSTGAWYVVNPMPTKTSDLVNDGDGLDSFISNTTAQITENQVTNLVGDLQNIREEAEGKTSSYVVSDSVLTVLDSQDSTVHLIAANFEDAEGVSHLTSDLKIGDNIYVVETDVPDRWVRNIEVYSSVSDLTGTDWEFNNNITSILGNWTAINLNFTANNTNYKKIAGYTSSGKINLQYTTSGGSASNVYDATNGWTDDNLKTIRITGGTDVANTNVINWLKNNATIQSTIYDVTLNILETVKAPIKSISVNNSAITPVNENVNITVPTKTSDITNDSGYITNLTAQITENQVTNLSSDLQNIREVAEGKKQTFVCSYKENECLDDQDNYITITDALIDIQGNGISLESLNIGDTIYVSEFNVPDRWVSEFLDRVAVTTATGNSSQASTPTATAPVNVVSSIYYDSLYNQIELRGIGNNKDIYNNGTITRLIGVYTFTGSETFDNGASGTLSGYRVLRNTSLFSNPIAIASTAEPFYCTHFNTVYSSTYTVPNQLTRWQSGANPTAQGMFCISEEILGISSSASQGQAVSAFQSWLATQNSNGTPVKVYFPLNTTTTENINLYSIGERTGAVLNILETAKVPITSISVNNSVITPVNSNVNITVPTKTSDITNDSGYITNSVNDLTYYTKTSDLATVALSGSFNDLTNKPTIDAAISTSSTNAVQNKAIPNYISSRAQQLVTNGSVTLCNNYNFSSFTYDGVYSNASGGSFALSNQATPNTDELMPVTKGKIYTLKYDLYPNYDFSTSGAVSAGINGFLPYLDQYDIDGNKIADTNTNYKDGTLVRLTQDLVNGATTAYVESTASFAAINGTTKVIQVWDYTNNNGYTWPAGTYTRHSFNISAFDTTTNTLTLVNAHSGATIPAGTYISQNRGGGYAYIGSYMKPAPNVWTTCTATTTSTTIRYGCAFAKIGWLWNYNVSNSQATTWSSSEAYSEGRGVKNGTIYYISKKAVPAGIDITNTDYWFTKNATSLVANVVTRMTNVSFTENGVPGVSGLTANKFVVGNGNSSIKISSMEPTVSTTTWSDSSDIYVPTMKAISNQFVKGSSLTNNYLTLGGGGRNIKASSYAPASSTTTWDTNSNVYLPTMKSISSWGSPKTGSSSITTVGTITSGVWNGTAIGDSYISSASTWTGKQDALVSGTNIKTINNTSILGSGNITIQSGGIELIDSIKYQDTVEALSLDPVLLMDSNTYGSVETFYIELVSSTDIWQGSSPIISTFTVTDGIPYIFTVTVFTTNIETLTFKVDYIYALGEYFIAISCIDYLSKLWLDRINIYKVS